MQGFIEVYRVDVLSMKVYPDPTLFAVGTISRVEAICPTASTLVLDGGASVAQVSGSISDIAAKIAAAQRPQVPEQEAALFDGPSIRVEGWGGMVALRACDITGIVAVSDSKTKSVIHLRSGRSVEALTEPEAVEALIRAARDAWSGKGAV